MGGIDSAAGILRQAGNSEYSAHRSHRDDGGVIGWPGGAINVIARQLCANRSDVIAHEDQIYALVQF